MVVAVQIWKTILFFAHVDREYLHSASDTRCSDLIVGCILAILAYRGLRLPVFLLRPMAITIPLSVLVSAAFVDATGHHRLAVAFFYTPAAIATALLIIQCVTLADRSPFRWLDWAWL